MESYLYSFESGKWQPPSYKVIYGWLNQFCLSRKELCDIIGLRTTSSLNAMLKPPGSKGIQFMSFAQCFRFLSWSKQLAFVDSWEDEDGTFLSKLKVTMIRNGVTMDDLFSHLKMSESDFYIARDHHCESLEKQILACDSFMALLNLSEVL